MDLESDSEQLLAAVLLLDNLTAGTPRRPLLLFALRRPSVVLVGQRLATRTL